MCRSVRCCFYSAKKHSFRAESDLRFNLDGPALGIRQLTPLDTGQGIVQLLGQGADLAAADVGNLAFPIQLLNGADNSCGAGAEHFFQLAFLGSLHHISNGQFALDNLVTPILEQLNDGAAGNAGQNSAGAGSGVDLCLLYSGSPPY